MTSKGLKKGVNLKKVIFVCGMISMLSVLLAVVLVLVPAVKVILTQNALQYTEKNFQESIKSVNTYISQVNDIVNLAELAVTDSGGNISKWSENVDWIVKSSDHIVRIGYYDSSGLPVYVSRPLATEEVSDCDWFQVARDRKGVVGYFSVPYVQHYSEDRYEYIISVSKMFRYMDREGTTCEGILVVDMQYKEFADLMKRTKMEQSGYIYVMDEYDQIVWHPNMRQISCGLYNENTDSVVKQIVGTTTDYDEGRERIIMAVPLWYGRWRLIGVSYVDEAVKIVRVIIQTIFAAIGIGVFLAFAGAAYTSFFVGKPLQQLEYSIRQIRMGEFEKISVQTKIQEIQDTEGAINVLIENIYALIKQVKEEQERKRCLEMDALQAQIKPHFLYNTLDSIVWLEEQGRNRDAIEMTYALSQLFRGFTSRKDSVITLQQEIEYTRNYLFIQKKRFSEKFNFSIDIPSEYLEIMIPKLVLQPIVENAILHGIDEYGDPMFLKVTAKAEEDVLKISVSDDGIGMTREKLKSLRKFSGEKTGVGLKNVHERIQLTFGTSYGVEINSTESEGTEVIIRIPAEVSNFDEKISGRG